VEYGRSGVRSFLLDAGGVIHFAREDRAATAADPPIH